MLKLVPKRIITKVDSLKLKRKVGNSESVIYAFSKKMKNNPCRIASAKLSNGDVVDLLIINNLKIKNKAGRYIVNTSEKEVSQKTPLHKFKKYLTSHNYKVISQPTMLLIINETHILQYSLSELFEIKYNKSAIKEFIRNEVRKFSHLQNSAEAN